jgi:hypothetical protein
VSNYLGLVWVASGSALAIWLTTEFVQAPPGARLTDAWLAWTVVAAAILVGFAYALGVRWSRFALGTVAALVGLMAFGALVSEIHGGRSLGILFSGGAVAMSVVTETLLLFNRTYEKHRS